MLHRGDDKPYLSVSSRFQANTTIKVALEIVARVLRVLLIYERDRFT